MWLSDFDPDLLCWSNLNRPMPEMNSVAGLYGRWRQGDQAAGDFLYTSAFRRLRTIAAALLSREQFLRTLQPTALVSELFLKFCRSTPAITDDEHFFHLSACAMRQVLLDYSRLRRARKRIPPTMVAELLQPRQAGDHELHLSAKVVFEKLQRLDRAASEVIWLRCVEGLTISEASNRLGIKDGPARVNYEFGLKWMADELSCGIR